MGKNRKKKTPKPSASHIPGAEFKDSGHDTSRGDANPSPAVEKLSQEMEQLPPLAEGRDNSNEKKLPEEQNAPVSRPNESQQAKKEQARSQSNKSKGDAKTPKGSKTVMMSETVGQVQHMYKIPTAKDLKSRPRGKAGIPIQVQVNHMEMKILLDKVYKFDIEVQTPWKRDNRKSDAPLFIRAFEEFKRKNSERFRNTFGVVYDGQKIAFSTYKLFDRFEGKVMVREEEDIEKLIELGIKMTFVGEVEIKNAITRYGEMGDTRIFQDEVTPAITVINTVMQYVQRVDSTKIVIGRSAFTPPKGGVTEIGGGKSLWTGLFSSFRPAWRPFLNVDMANKPGYDENNVIDFLKKCLQTSEGGRGRGGPPGRGRGRGGPPERGRGRGGYHGDRFGVEQPVDLSQLSRENTEVLNLSIKGLKIRYEMPDSQKRDSRAVKLGPKSNMKGQVDIEGKKMSVCDYYLENYKYKIKYPDYPTLQIGNPQRNIFIPLERCKVKAQACPNSKKLTEEETSKMIRHTAIPPAKRQEEILSKVREANKYFTKNDHVKEFGLTIADEFTKINARLIEAPELAYQDKQSNDKKHVKVSDGKWKMQASQTSLKFIDQKQLDLWAVLDLAYIDNSRKEKFVDMLYKEGEKCGFHVEYPLYFIKGRGESVEESFKRIMKEKNFQLVMVFVSSKGGMDYALIKHLGDTHYKLPTQFVLKKNVLGKQNGPDPATLHNICLKLNSKLGGTNQILSNPEFGNVNFKRPVMFIGADVTHPSPDQKGSKPSIAAMVGSMDPKISQFGCQVRIQPGNQDTEVILDTESMMISLLKLFFDKNKGRKPEKLIFYRDGVSEGQFLDVMNQEVSAIKRACKALQKEEYEPPITYIVAQKRHKTRIFAIHKKDTVGRNENVKPGTVVDTVITSPTEQSFFLASHEGIQGTTRPTCYHVLFDENDLHPDSLQKLTYFLCHLYARCERSVSYPAPTYYAHLAAFRARDHHNVLIEKRLEKNKKELEKMENLLITDYFI